MSVSIIDKRKEWDRIKKEIKSFKNGHTSIGFFTSGGTPQTDLAARAMVNEYGTKNGRIPSRPFMRRTFDKNQGMIREQIDSLYDKVIAGSLTAKQALSQLGEWYRALMILTIRAGGFIPNAPSTRKKKGDDKPLVDSGEMVRGIIHKETI